MRKSRARTQAATAATAAKQGRGGEDQEAAAGPAAAVPVARGRWGGVVCGRVAAKGESFTVHLQSSIAYGFIAWNSGMVSMENA